VLSGGNIDPLVLLHVIQHGMASASRYLSLRVRVGDRPGALAELLVLLGRLGANVVDVEHSRVSATLPLGQVEVALALETRGREHCGDIVDALRAAGHAVVDVGAAEG
jgi:threonine dehydratase